MENREKNRLLHRAYGLQRSGLIICSAVFLAILLALVLGFPDAIVAYFSFILAIGVISVIAGYEMEINLEDDHGKDH